MVQRFQVRVLVVDNDPFTLTLVTEALAAANFAVSGVPTVPDAVSTIESFSPNAIVTDLNFGHGAPTGADLLAHVDEHHPWIGKVVLTSHGSASLALPMGNQLTGDVVYLVKAQVSSVSDLVSAVNESITGHNGSLVPQVNMSEQIRISKAQGEILLMISEGYTNAAIARRRGTSLRSTEALVQRTFTALGLGTDADFNPRTKAVRMWQQGKIVVK
jgi:DNA-binding NarL/FixJ family response regulator|tara:strand:+ start:171 stop:818 length:648 start_codon:yes stop_codon:yes gene_type:complete